MKWKQTVMVLSGMRRLTLGCVVTGLLVLSFPQLSFAEEISGFGKGVITPSYNDPGAGLLSAFYFRFTHGDHPLQYIAAHPLSNSTMEVAFSDRNPRSNDDRQEYFFKVISQRQTEPSIIQKSASNVCVSYCPLEDPQLNDSKYIFVLRGFKFTYSGDDYAIKKIKISKVGGAIDVELHDRGGLNKFTVTVDYALVPKELIASTGSIQGQSKGATRRLIPSGRAIISGFSLEYPDDDYRMQEFGILATQPTNPGSNIEIYFNDQSLSRKFNYQVDYAILTGRSSGL